MDDDMTATGAPVFGENCLVRTTGVEPVRIAPRDFKTVPGVDRTIPL